MRHMVVSPHSSPTLNAVQPLDRPAPRIAVVVVNWNGWQHTLECLKSLRAAASPKWHLFIVDNASTDDSVDRLSDLGDDTTLIVSPTNTGWTGGNNIGVRQACQLGFEYMFVLNNDAQVEANTLERLLAVSANIDDGNCILGPIHRDPKTGEFNFVGTVINDYSGMPDILTAQAADIGFYDEVEEVPYVVGAGIFARASTFKAVGEFDDRFFLNYDEVDWSYRARKLGHRSYVVRSARIEHAGSAAFGGKESALRTYFVTRNRLLFSELHLSLRYKLRALKITICQFRRLQGGDGKIRWVLSALTARDPLVFSYRQGCLDYMLRRFGDSSDKIRRLSDPRGTKQKGNNKSDNS